MKSFAIFLLFFGAAHAASFPPPEAQKYKRLVVANAHAVWGLNAPIAVFGAQLHQESRWNENARSPVGASGLAQFMPSTADWIAGLYPAELGSNQPLNPAWAVRALVRYDLWLYERITAMSHCERWAFTLSSYNGGLGWVQRDKRLAVASGADPLRWFGHVDRYNAGRSAAAFRENRGYPERILLRWQPTYSTWGASVPCPTPCK